MTGTPRKGPTTAAMRLRPAAGPARPATRAQLFGRLELVVELHGRLELSPVGLCRECLLPHPCPTYVAATGGARTTDSTEEGSQ